MSRQEFPSHSINRTETAKPESGFLGILMLDTDFPRYVGDIGNSDTFDYPVRKAVVSTATPKQIILHSPEALLPDFIAAARTLEAEGARLITTSCGFLTVFQVELQAAVSVPVLASSLFLFNDLQAAMKPGQLLGILTIAASSLSPRHLAAAGIPPHTAIGTTETGSEFTPAILENRTTLDFDRAEADNVAAAIALKARYPDLGGILLECTNMPPYADAISKATGLPVWSIIDGLNKMWATPIT